MPTKLNNTNGHRSERRAETSEPNGKELSSQERIRLLQERLKEQEERIFQQDEILTKQAFRLRFLEVTSYDGVLVWRISDFSRKRRQAIMGQAPSDAIIDSPCFFTNRFGYKMRARIYLNGDGAGKGTHASVVFVVMKGEYDAILAWPFQPRVTVAWLNQADGQHMVETFQPDPLSQHFERPTCEMSSEHAWPLFMPKSLLENKDTAFVKEDTAFIKVVVATVLQN